MASASELELEIEIEIEIEMTKTRQTIWRLMKPVLLVGFTLFSILAPLAGVSATADRVRFDFRLANTPLETSVGPESNVLLLHDDSLSMLHDILVDSPHYNALYLFPGGEDPKGDIVAYVNQNTDPRLGALIAPRESDAPDEGIWRLRNSAYNTIYYNPEIRYRPWEGLDTSDAYSPHRQFADAPPTAARYNPLSAVPTIDLTAAISFTGKAIVTSPDPICRSVCELLNSKNFCVTYKQVCTDKVFQDVPVSDFYTPRYYIWTDRNQDGQLDATPSPATHPETSEGQLVEIRSGSTYVRAPDRTDCATRTDSCTYDEELQNFANWFTYYRTRELMSKAALGVVVSRAANLRIGYAGINNFTDMRPVASMNRSNESGAKAALLAEIYQARPAGQTPLRQALSKAGEYFACTGNSHPCPILPIPAGRCQQNFVLMITDGIWSGSAPIAAIGDADADNNTGFDGGAFAGVANTLADVAMHYYERDISPRKGNRVPTTARDRALAAADAFKHNSNELTFQHVSTYVAGFGVRGDILHSPVDFTKSFAWGDPFFSNRGKIDDLRHAAYNGRGDYLDASNGADLARRLAEAFQDFFQSSGAASAVSFSSQKIREAALIFRTSYNTKDNTGDLVAQVFSAAGLLGSPVWSAAKRLDMVAATDRNILTWNPHTATGIAFRADRLTSAQREVFIADATVTTAQKDAEVRSKVNYLRGDAAAERPLGDFRKRPALAGRLGDIIHSTPVFVGPPDRKGRALPPYPQGDNAYAKFIDANVQRTAIIYVESNDGMLHGFNAASGDEVFGYVPGNLITGAFSHPVTDLLEYGYTHQYFADVTPAINDVFIDSNADGSKEWTTLLVGGHGAGAKAYFALNITDPDNLTERHADKVVMWEFTEADDAYPTDAGGQPLTNADGTQRQDLQASPQPVKDLGFSFSVPTIAMSNVVDASGDHEWIALFGNGYNSTAGIAKLFTLFIDRGQDGLWCHPDLRFNVTLGGSLPAGCTGKQDFYKLDTGYGAENGFPNGLGVPRGIDADGNGTVDYAYAGDLLGNFFRFDLTSPNPRDWSATKIFEASYTDSTGASKRQPITTQPVVTLRETPSGKDFIVLFATGSYITVADSSSEAIQSIYGILDRRLPGRGLIAKSSLVEQTFKNEYTADRHVRTLSNNVVDYTLAATRGWYIDLDVPVRGGTGVEFPGERAIRNFQLRGELAFINSIVPGSGICKKALGGGFALSFCPQTGSVSCTQNRGIFDLNNDGRFDELDDVAGYENTPGYQGTVAAIRFERAVPSDAAFIGNLRVTQLGERSLDIIATNTEEGRANKNTGRLSWRQLDRVD